MGDDGASNREASAFESALRFNLERLGIKNTRFERRHVEVEAVGQFEDRAAIIRGSWRATQFPPYSGIGHNAIEPSERHVSLERTLFTPVED